MNADEFRDNILGFIFYKYLSERLSLYADSLLIQDDIKFAAVDDSTEDGRAILQAVSDAAIDELGYFLKPSELFRAVAQRSSKPGQFILEDLARIVGAYRSRTVTDRFSHRALLSEVAENDDNLNIPRYVDTFKAGAQIDLAAVAQGLRANAAGMADLDAQIAAFCAELGIEAPL